jgi:hypothetical protein
MNIVFLRKPSLILIAIILLAFFLRGYLVDKIPSSLSADEVAVGYNSYSILKTGRDEFGQRLPLTFRSFDDFKNPLLIYSLVPVIYFFGLSDLPLRLFSVFVGTVTVFLFFLICRELTKNEKLALIVTFFAAVSPWLIQYSRVMVEMEYSLFSTLIGVWFFLKGEKQIWLCLVAAFFFGLSFYTYHSNKIWLVIILPVLLVLYRRVNKASAAFFIIFLVMLLPFFFSLKTSRSTFRPYTVSVFSNLEKIYDGAKLIVSDDQQKFIGGNFFHNRRFTLFNLAANSFLHILRPEILFGQNEDNQISSTRLFYLWQLPLLILGVVVLAKRKKLAVILFVWIFSGFLPGGLTNLPGYDRRILLAAFPLLFLTGWGANYILKYRFVPLVIFIFFLISFCFYLHNYFVHGRKEVVRIWGAGMKDMVFAAEKIKNKYHNVYISVYLNQPLTYFLFYNQYSPSKYLSAGGTRNGAHYNEENRLENYIFKVIDQEDLRAGDLYVWEASENQPCLFKIKTINMPNDQPAAYLGIYDPTLPECLQIM